MDKKKIEDSVTSTITESDLTDISSELLEVGIDEILDEGLLQSLPTHRCGIKKEAFLNTGSFYSR